MGGAAASGNKNQNISPSTKKAAQGAPTLGGVAAAAGGSGFGPGGQGL